MAEPSTGLLAPRLSNAASGGTLASPLLPTTLVRPHASSQLPQRAAAVVAQVAAAGQRKTSWAIQTRAINPLTAFPTLLAILCRRPSNHKRQNNTVTFVLLHCCCAQQSTSRLRAPSRPRHELGVIFCQPVTKRVTLHHFRPFYAPRHEISAHETRR
jgi:hypothetical protein